MNLGKIVADGTGRVDGWTSKVLQEVLADLKSKNFDDIFLNIVRTFLEECVVGMDIGLEPFLKPYCLTFSAKAPARVSLAVTTLLAMSTTMASIQVEET